MGRFSFSSFADLVSYCRDTFRAFFLILSWSAITSDVSVSAWSRIRPTSGSEIVSHEEYCRVLFLQGSKMPKPPRRAGNASRSLMSLKETWPVRFGRKTFQIVSSSGLRRVSMFGVVLAR